MNKNKPTTLKDVAEFANVSAATVSRALRTPDLVSPKTREKIDAAIAAMDYVPDPAARALASSRTNVIGVLVPSVSNNVFSGVLNGIYEAVEGSGFDIQLGYTRYSVLNEESLVRLFLRQRPAGLIVTGTDQSATTRTLLEHATCPVVQIMEFSEDPIDMMIGFSHYEASREGTQHLIDMGYTKPGFLGARMDPRTQRRFAGFRDATEAAGLFSETRVCTTTAHSSVTLGGQLFADLVANAPDVDAVFCINDDIALGALFEAQRRRISVPEQLGICGFNDFEMMAATEPTITSVRTFRNDMGRRAVAMLIDAINGIAHSPEENVVNLGYEVRPRQSTARSGGAAP